MVKSVDCILLADDDPDDQMTFTEAFGRLQPDINVVCVEDGEEVLAWLESCANLPRLILMDYKMPIASAPTVLKRLASIDRFAPIIKIIWSTSARKDHMDECLHLGADQYLTKPNDGHELEVLIRKINLAIFKDRRET
jgi:CheY-like chemotaxis protein